MSTLTVALPDPMWDWVEEQVRNGDYADPGDYLLDLIRDDQERHNTVVQALIEGEESGICTRSLKEIIVDAKAKIRDGTL